MEAQSIQDQVRHEQERKFAYALIPENDRDNFPIWGARGMVSTLLAEQQERGEWDQEKLLKAIQKKLNSSDSMKQEFAVIAETYARDEKRFEKALQDMHSVDVEQL